MKRFAWLIVLILLLTTGAPEATVQSVDGVYFPTSVDGVSNPTSVDNVEFWWSPGRTWSYNPATGILTNTLGLSSELGSNVGFETGSPPTGWTGFHVTPTQVTDNCPGSAGTKAIQAVSDGYAGYAGVYQASPSLTAGRVYAVSGWLKYTVGSGNCFMRMTDFGGNIYTTPVVNTSSWTFVSCTGVSLSTGVGQFALILSALATAGDTFRADDCSWKSINIPDLFLTKQFGWSTGTIAIPIANASTLVVYQGGGVACLDSASNPLNYFRFYRNGTGNICLDKMIAGVWTSIINTATGGTYHQNYYLVFKRTATTIQIFYNADGGTSNQIGSDYTLVGGDPAGTIHGYFATDVSVLLGQGIFTQAVAQLENLKQFLYANLRGLLWSLPSQADGYSYKKVA